MNSASPELSIVIPAYNEERRLPRAFENIRAWLEGQDRSVEIIVVDDGSTDGTRQVLEAWQARLPEVRFLSYEENHGKGCAVREGMLASRGRLALFTDADLSAPIEEADKLLALLGSYDVAFGSRAVDRSLIAIRQPLWREWAGILFNKVVQILTGLPWVDTQCGFKAFVRERAQILFEQQRIEDFGFDPEILFLAKRHGLRVIEVPVRWAHDPDSKVRVARDGLKMLAELLQIRWNALRGRYPRASPR